MRAHPFSHTHGLPVRFPSQVAAINFSSPASTSSVRMASKSVSERHEDAMHEDGRSLAVLPSVGQLEASRGSGTGSAEARVADKGAEPSRTTHECTESERDGANAKANALADMPAFVLAMPRASVPCAAAIEDDVKSPSLASHVPPSLHLSNSSTSGRSSGGDSSSSRSSRRRKKPPPGLPPSAIPAEWSHQGLQHWSGPSDELSSSCIAMSM